ncbi:unnamed protein product [Schistocephalus solidus]|uniref:Protocadherin Fat 4 n=1 Tax=Schistocephalus solidus TaxID=70667 RepID=A0A183SGY0_SCHSO|nr:unnamed protein product [Schistocephalus solidus]
MEHSEAGRFVGNIYQAAKFTQPIQALNLESSVTNFSQFFSIDTASGVIRTKYSNPEILDRERICPPNFEETLSRLPEIDFKECRMSLLLSLNNKILISVSIIIDDLNDNAPAFYENNKLLTELSISVYEDALVNATRQKLPIALDPDGTSNQVVLYKLIGDQLPFRLEQPNFLAGQLHPHLIVTSPLDYEHIPRYSFFLQTCESKDLSSDSEFISSTTSRLNEPKCSSTYVIVNMLNVNDNSPKFINASYTTIVKENSPVGTTLLTLRAIDADAPPFGNVSYFIKEQEGLPFSVDEVTGRLFLASTELYQNQYSFVVEATDGQPQTQMYEELHGVQLSNVDSALVTIFVVDVNDHAPSIEVRHASNQTLVVYATFLAATEEEEVFVAELSEETTDQVVLAYFTIRDEDEGENAVCSCRLDPDSPSNFFSKFSVSRVNQLSQQAYIYRLAAISPLDAEDPLLGLHLRTPVQADRCRGTAGFLPVTIECSDAGAVPLTSYRTIFIAVQDLNEFSTIFPTPALTEPVFLGPDGNLVYQLNVSENTPTGTEIYTISATDKDASQCIEYFLDGTSEASQFVEIMPYRGTLVLLRMFDYETLRKFSFRVFAREKTPGKNNGSIAVATIEISVLNENDNRPKVDFPPALDQTTCAKIKTPLLEVAPSNIIQPLLSNEADCFVVDVLEETAVGTTLIVLNASDEDSPGNGSFFFMLLEAFVPELTSGALQQRYLKSTRLMNPPVKMEPGGGIRVSGRLDREETKWIDLVFSVSDDGLSSMTSTGILRITLRDVNDNAPSWQFPSANDYHLSIGLVTEVGSFITRVQASDTDDEGGNGEVEYAIALLPSDPNSLEISSLMRDELRNAYYGYDFFEIKSDTGEISTKRMFSNSSIKFFRLDLIATDKGQRPQSSQAHLLITVSDAPFTDVPSVDVNYVQNDDIQVADQGFGSGENPAEEKTPVNFKYELTSSSLVYLIGIFTGICAIILFIFLLSFVYCKQYGWPSRTVTLRKSKCPQQLNPVNLTPCSDPLSLPPFSSSSRDSSCPSRTWIPLEEAGSLQLKPSSPGLAQEPDFSLLPTSEPPFPVIALPVHSVPLSLEPTRKSDGSALPDVLLNKLNVPIFVSIAVVPERAGEFGEEDLAYQHSALSGDDGNSRTDQGPSTHALNSISLRTRCDQGSKSDVANASVLMPETEDVHAKKEGISRESIIYLPQSVT